MDTNEAIAATHMGCQFESQLYQAFSCTKNLVITYGKPIASVILSVNFCSANRISNLVVGVLYKLHYQHPAIDFVGLLKGSDEALYLLMVQASLSYYVDHKAKLLYLDKMYDKQSWQTSRALLTLYI